MLTNLPHDSNCCNDGVKFLSVEDALSSRIYRSKTVTVEWRMERSYRFGTKTGCNCLKTSSRQMCTVSCTEAGESESPSIGCILSSKTQSRPKVIMACNMVGNALPLRDTMNAERYLLMLENEARPIVSICNNVHDLML